jgi:very-short-patch-repair endonuclease
MNRYSVDFVVCSREEISPLLAIELDDHSHQSTKRITRDAHVDEILDSAGIAYLRIPCQASYNFPQMKALIDGKLNQIPKT